MFIPDEKVEEVRAASDIVDVVGEYVRLKKQGSNYFGLCPFHNEKSPSFSVNAKLGIYKCFGCGVGGNVFQFIMGVEQLTFPEAVRLLAERARIPLPEPGGDSERSSELESIYQVLRFAARFYYEQLTQSERGKPALEYLLGRGLSPRTITQFGLGYAPDEWDALLRAATEAHFPARSLEAAGLVLPRKNEGGGHYDRFRDRIVFPIISHVGKVLGFGGRVYRGGSDQPKYINSPETDAYRKSRVLYGLYQARQTIRKLEEAILVEGYMDVISLHQAGVTHAVASSGTALTVDQVQLLGRYAKRVLMLYDADSAGAGAALRGIDLVLQQGLPAYAVALPPGDDPDSFVRTHGAEAFEEYLVKQRQDFVSFKVALARRSGAFDTPEGEAGAMRSVVQTIAMLPDALMQETYLRRAADVLQVPDIRLHEALGAMQRQQTTHPPREVPAPNESAAGADDPVRPEAEANRQPDAREPLPEEKALLRLMLEDGLPMVEYILSAMGLDEFSEGPSRDMVTVLLDHYEQGRIDRQRYLNGEFGSGVQQLASEVLVDRYEPSENWTKRNIAVPRLNEERYEAAASAMVLLKLDRVQEAIRRTQEEIFRATQAGDDIRPLQERMIQLFEWRKRVEQREFLQEAP